MEFDVFAEREHIILTALEMAQYNGTVIVVPASFSRNTMFVKTSHCKNCAIRFNNQHVAVLLAQHPCFWYPYTSYDIIDTISLANPDSLVRLGTTLASIFNKQ
jgi:hypothetical protein